MIKQGAIKYPGGGILLKMSIYLYLDQDNVKNKSLYTYHSVCLRYLYFIMAGETLKASSIVYLNPTAYSLY